jgi:hypothetical protein
VVCLSFRCSPHTLPSRGTRISIHHTHSVDTERDHSFIMVAPHARAKAGPLTFIERMKASQNALNEPSKHAAPGSSWPSAPKSAQFNRDSEKDRNKTAFNPTATNWQSFGANTSKVSSTDGGDPMVIDRSDEVNKTTGVIPTGWVMFTRAECNDHSLTYHRTSPNLWERLSATRTMME